MVCVVIEKQAWEVGIRMKWFEDEWYKNIRSKKVYNYLTEKIHTAQKIQAVLIIYSILEYPLVWAGIKYVPAWIAIVLHYIALLVKAIVIWEYRGQAESHYKQAVRYTEPAFGKLWQVIAIGILDLVVIVLIALGLTFSFSGIFFWIALVLAVANAVFNIVLIRLAIDYYIRSIEPGSLYASDLDFHYRKKTEKWD